jgi:hypothetical protein
MREMDCARKAMFGIFGGLWHSRPCHTLRQSFDSQTLVTNGESP